MASSTTNLDLISSSQASKEVTANSLFDAESPAALYGRRASTTANLTWGYYGGYLSIDGVPAAIANGTVALTNAATNYITAARATGNVAASTSNASWNDTANHARLYSVVTSGNLVTSYTDVRSFALGAAEPLIGVDAGNAQQVDQTPQSWARNSTTALGNTSVNGTLSATGNTVNVFTGTANVTYHVRCLGNGIIVHNASVTNVLQGAANISTNAGDTFDVEMVTANTCNIKNYMINDLAAHRAGSASQSFSTAELTASGVVTANAGLGVNTSTLNGVMDVYKAGSGNASIGLTVRDNVTPGYASNADNLLTVRGTGNSSAVWRGRITAGGDNKCFLMGEYLGAAWLGAHTADLTAWADVYISPDGAQTTYIGGLSGSPIVSIDNATGRTSFVSVVRLAGYTVATLPAGSIGDRAYVTDANAPTWNGALTGGGTVSVPVFRNATGWVSA
jgi:hypothetical protein